MHMKTGSAREIRALLSMIEKGPHTVVLVFTKTCPHCISYMPIWDELKKTEGRKANMISMEAGTYQKTHLSEKKPVTGVPTVLYVNKKGEIAEAPEPRNKTVMTDVLRSEIPAAEMKSSEAPESASEPVSEAPIESASPVAEIATSEAETSYMPETGSLLENAVIPGTTVSENPLEPVPAMPVQRGGNPWAAFLLAARQAAPAAALLGAYAALPPKRASGLRAPRRSRRTHRKIRTRS
jgi:thiol-disulfide isomerase/thioredoxin